MVSGMEAFFEVAVQRGVVQVDCQAKKLMSWEKRLLSRYLLIREVEERTWVKVDFIYNLLFIIRRHTENFSCRSKLFLRQ